MSSSSSTNSNNQNSASSYYDADVDQSHALRYVVPTTSNLSRGIKGTVQRMFTGEPLNNLCNVYVYDHSTELWDHEATISGSSGEDFGRSMDGTDDAEMIAIGGPGTWFGSRSDTTGKVRVYTKNNSGTGWSQRGSDISKSNGGGFGHAVALSHQDGSILVIGAPFHNTLTPSGFSYPVSEGKVWVYKWNSSSSQYSQVQEISSLSGTLTSSTPSDWKNFYFGYSLGISNHGKSIIIGEPSFRDIWYYTRHVQQGTNYKYTGNAHVYYNSTLTTTGGTTWTSNVSVTEKIGITGIGTTDDTDPTKVRWMDGVGTSVDINRKGDIILAGAPFSYGTSNAAPQQSAGRIYTLSYDKTNNIWNEMGETSKHIVANESHTFIGYSARFDGSGQRIVSGAPQPTAHIQYYKGKVYVYDWNGDQWVSFPGETVEVNGWNTDGTYWTAWQHKVGECVSIDGEGEMIAIANNQHHFDLHNSNAKLRPETFSVKNIEYIGDGGSNGNINNGGSNLWVYNIQQSIRVKGNFTVGGFVQATGIAVGTEDDSNKTQKSIFFGGTKSDNSYEQTVIENRVYDSEEKAELLLFKGNDNADSYGGGTHGPDRIRLKGGQIVFDLHAGYDRTQEDIRAVMHRNAGGAGMLGINVTSPTECLHVDGKVKATQGFIGNGTEITGLDLHHITGFTSAATGVAGSTTNNMELGRIITFANATFPNGAMTSNTTGVSGYTITASRDVSNAWKGFDDNTSDGWDVGNKDLYPYWSSPAYLGTTEKVAGYKGEWIELQMPSKIFIQKVEIYVNNKRDLPRTLYTFGSNDGVSYYLIHTESGKSLNWGSANQYNEVYNRSNLINASTDISYNRILLIAGHLTGQGSLAPNVWRDIKITGMTATYDPKIKLDKMGKIGVGTTNPNAACHVIGNINVEGQFKQNNSTLIGLGSSSSAGAPLQVLASTSNTSPTNNGIFLSQTGTSGTNHAIMAMKVNGTNSGDPFVSWDTDDTGWSMGIDNSDDDKLKIAKSKDEVSINTEMTIDTDGKVGIGTTTPAYLLDVNGDINIAGGSSLRIGGVAQSFGGGGGSSLSGTNTFEWGTGVSGKETNAGKIGYSTWSTGTNDALDIVGAGPANPAGTLRTVRIWDKLGIGTSSPSGPLHIYESTGSSRSATSGTLVLDHGDSGGSSCIVFPSRRNNNSDYGYIQYEDSTSSGDEKSRLIIGTENDGSGSNEDNVILAPSGKVGIGTDTPAAPLHINASSTGTSPSSNGIYVRQSNNDKNAVMGLRVNGNGSGNPYVSWDIEGQAGWSAGIDNSNGDCWDLCENWDLNSSSGNVVAQAIRGSGRSKFQVYTHDGSVTGDSNWPSWGGGFATWDILCMSISYSGLSQRSDRNLKDNIVDIPVGLSQILQLRPVRYTWKDVPDGGPHYGLIAQEAESIIPELVRNDGDSNTYRIKQEIVPILIKATQELNTKITTLETDNASLKTKVSTLETQVADLLARVTALENA